MLHCSLFYMILMVFFLVVVNNPYYKAQITFRYLSCEGQHIAL